MSSRIVLALAALLSVPVTARADDIQPSLRYTFGDASFPSNEFSAATHASSKSQQTQLRVTGKNDLPGGFSLNYDLRYGWLYSEQTVGGVRTVARSSGLQDQTIELRYALIKLDDYSGTLGLGVIAPGSAFTSPALGTSQWALQPTYYASYKPGLWDVTVGLSVGARIYTDGGAAQLRNHLEVAMPVAPGVKLAGEFTFIRSARLADYVDAIDHGEIGDVFRAGVQATYDLGDGVQPMVAYDDWVAGKGGHASERLTVGVRYSY